MVEWRGLTARNTAPAPHPAWLYGIRMRKGEGKIDSSDASGETGQQKRRNGRIKPQ